MPPSNQDSRSPAGPQQLGKEVRTVIRTHKIALRPSRRQRRLLKKCAAYARFAHNWMLHYFMDRLAAGDETYPTHMLRPVWDHAKASVCPWGRKLPQSAAKYGVYGLNAAIEAWRNKRCANQFPRFHSRHKRIAFRADEGADTVTCKGKTIYLPAIGAVRMRQPLRLRGSILEVTILCEADRWFACVTLLALAPRRSRGTEIVGVDVGVEMLASCSDETTHKNPRARLRHWPEIKRCKDQLAGKTQGVRRQLNLPVTTIRIAGFGPGCGVG